LTACHGPQVTNIAREDDLLVIVVMIIIGFGIKAGAVLSIMEIPVTTCRGKLL
jgi:hypothetical protein